MSKIVLKLVQMKLSFLFLIFIYKNGLLTSLRFHLKKTKLTNYLPISVSALPTRILMFVYETKHTTGSPNDFNSLLSLLHIVENV